MKRGILLTVLALVATVPVGVAPAAEQQFVVYELTRARAGGPSTVPIHVVVSSDGAAGTASFLQLAPRQGGGWTRAAFRVVQYNPTETRFAVYGPEAGPPPMPCPVNDQFCGAEGEDGFYLWAPTFRPATGHRYFVAVPPIDAWVFVPPQWRLRRVTLGARQVMAQDTSSAGAVANRRKHEAFVSASATGGKYGSGVFAQVPCETGDSAGRASVKSDGSDAAVALTCEPDKDIAFSGTLDGTTWTLTGPVVGEYTWPLRLFVFDYPKR